MPLTKVDTQLLSNGITTDSTGLNTITNGNLKVLASAAGTNRTIIFQNEVGTQATLGIGTTGGTGGTNTFYVQTNAGVSMQIDSSGRMTRAYQPAFCVYSNANIAVGSGVQAVYLNTKDIDIGNNYNTSLGRFTAPVAGQYVFNAIVAVDSTATNISYVSAEIRKNGGRFVWNGWNAKPGTTNTYTNSTGTFVVTLAAGDYIELGTEVNASVTLVGAYGAGCKLSGFLLS